jgi:hypothetical protein
MQFLPSFDLKKKEVKQKQPRLWNENPSLPISSFLSPTHLRSSPTLVHLFSRCCCWRCPRCDQCRWGLCALPWQGLVTRDIVFPHRDVLGLGILRFGSVIGLTGRLGFGCGRSLGMQWASWWRMWRWLCWVRTKWTGWGRVCCARAISSVREIPAWWGLLLDVQGLPWAKVFQYEIDFVTVQLIFMVQMFSSCHLYFFSEGQIYIKPCFRLDKTTTL